MRALFTFLFVLVTHSIFAQNKKINNEFEKGNIKNGYKEGVWEYYDKPGELALKIDYSAAKLLFLKSDTSGYVIKVNDEWVKSKLDVQPRYIGSMNDFGKVYSTIQYPAEARANGIAGKFYITFEIDTLGRLGQYEVINDIGYGCAQVVIKALKKLPNYWLSAQKDGKSYPAKFILPVTCRIVLKNKEISPEKSKKSKEPPLARELDAIVIGSGSGRPYVDFQLKH